MKDLDKPLNYYRNEVNFLDMVIEPLWKCVNMWLQPSLDNQMDQLESNFQEYKRRRDQYVS